MPKPPAPPPPGPVGDFAHYLRDLLIQAGKPDYSRFDYSANPEAGAYTSTLLSYSGHTSVASLARYACVSPDALARWQAERDPDRRR